ncbi:MAG TPA: serine hydrolase [Thermoanaerobaculia bacterium]|jgi:beta-lactamase class A|nr:serine hydrolase [Thermoanaerobaculia bacterium]
MISSLRTEIEQIAHDAGAEQFGVAFHDYETHQSWSCHGDLWFHAASTIKMPVLLGVYGAIHEGLLSEESRVHVRNRFFSVVDGSRFRVDASRDPNSEVQRAIGRTMKVQELAHHMIATSSNLATNLLIDVIGIEEMRRILAPLHLDGVELRRGVEDELAWQAGLNNRVTAHGLLHALRLIGEEQAYSADVCRRMLDLLHQQQFKDGIPAGLPEGARVAHKTGEISTAAHDAGIVFLPDREPYVLAVLTQWPPEGGRRHEVIARISQSVFEHLRAAEEELA